jgi:hypothetical protein
LFLVLPSPLGGEGQGEGVTWIKNERVYIDVITLEEEIW